jgi:stage III sporulation protein AD
MDIFQIAAIAIIGTILAITVKPYRAEIAVLISVGTGVLILLQIIGSVSGIFSEFYSLIAKSGVDLSYFTLIVKIIGIAYVTQLASEICKDAGQGAVALKVELAGKALVMLMTMPVLSQFLQVIIEILQ